MGAIARNIANNITTSGVFTPDALDSGSVTGITALANASDGITLISSQTASASASISFTTGIDATYKAYKFVFSNIHPSNDDVLLNVNFSTDSGSSYNVTKTTTFFEVQHDEADTATSLQYNTGADLAQSTGDQRIMFSLGTDNDQSCAGTLTLFNPSSTTYVKHFISTCTVYHNANSASQAYVAGYANTTSAVNAIIFRANAGNIDAGTIYLYGIK